MKKDLSKYLLNDDTSNEKCIDKKKYNYLNENNYLIQELQIHQIELETQNEELKCANLETESALKKYFDLYNLSPVGHFTINKECKILKVNIAGTLLLGIEKGDLKEKQFQIFVEKNSLPIFNSFCDNLFNGILKQKCEIVLLNSDGNRINAYIDGFLMLEPEEDLKHLLLTITDITDLRQIEGELKETLLYDKMRSDFFQNISHEFRTPLNVIFAALQLIDFNLKNHLQPNNNLSMEKHLSIVKQNCRRLLKLINNLIDVTKVGSDHYKLNFQNENIVLIVSSIILSVLDFVQSKGISLSFISNIKEREMAFDSVQIERVILNIISNSIKFTKPGGEIIVSLNEEKDQIVISIKDTGIGIPKEYLKDVFKMFKQVDSALTRENEGSGIGLSLIKSLIELHGGNIHVESELGKGSDFIIELPIKILKQVDSSSRNNEDRKLEQVERIRVEFSDIYS